MIRSRSIPQLCAAAATVLLLALPAAASAAPDWTPSSGLAKFGEPTVEYDARGEETAVHHEITSQNPLKTRVVVTTRRPGGGFEEQLVLGADGTTFPFNPHLAVAPNGAAVLGFNESATTPSGPVNRFRTAYRSPAGVWEAPVTIATDTASLPLIESGVTVGIGPDGTASAVAIHLEPNTAGEATADSRADAIVHPASGGWETSPFRLSAVDHAAVEVQAGVDASGNVTVTYGDRYNEAPDRFTTVVRRRSASNGVWTSPEDLTHASPAQSAPPGQLYVAPDGRAVLGLQSNKTGKGQAYAAVRETSGGNFGAPQLIADPADFSSTQAVGIAPDGTTYAAYADEFNAVEGEHLGLVRAAPGAGFSKPQRVSSRDVADPAARIDFSHGDAVVAWTGHEPGGQEHVIQGTRWAANAAAADAFDELDAPSTQNLTIEDVSADPEGGVLAVWSTDNFNARAAAFDGGAPVERDASVPSDAVQGQAVAMRASFADRWSPLAGAPAWDFGDGATATGNEVTHAFAALGDHTVTVRQPDALGNTRTRTFTVHVSAAPPPAEAPAAPTPPAQSPPAAPAAPTVTLSAPRCSRKLSKAQCRLFLVKRSTWANLRGTQTGTARVQVIVKRKGAKAKVVKATVRGGKWTARVRGLERGATTFTVRGFATAGTASKSVARKVRLR